MLIYSQNKYLTKKDKTILTNYLLNKISSCSRQIDKYFENGDDSNNATADFIVEKYVKLKYKNSKSKNDLTIIRQFEKNFLNSWIELDLYPNLQEIVNNPNNVFIKEAPNPKDPKIVKDGDIIKFIKKRYNTDVTVFKALDIKNNLFLYQDSKGEFTKETVLIKFKAVEGDYYEIMLDKE